MGGRSGTRRNRKLKYEPKHGEWIAYINEYTGAIKWIRKKKKKKRKL